MKSSYFRRLTLRVLLVALAVTVGNMGYSLLGSPPSLSVTEALAAPKASKRASKDNYDLTQLEVLKKVVVYVNDNYVDPKRIDPKEMFVSALEAVEKSTAEVMVEGAATDGKVKVTVGAASQTFKFGDLDSLWMIPTRIRPVFAFIQDNLVTTDDRREIEYAAINGMLGTLDPHSWLLKPDVYREMKLQTKGEFGGLGFVIAMEEERLTVKKVLKNTPASRAGIKKSDHITRIEDESTINMDLNEAVSKLRGKPGTEIRIFVKRGADSEKKHVLVRDLISIESVTHKLLDGGVGYVRVSSFAGTTARDLTKAIAEMKKSSGGKLNGLVLDLRSNPGGLLDQAIQVADLFVDEGTIVTTAGMSDKLREPKSARRHGGEREFPIAVLVNSESASASEIVAGAIKNLGRGVVIGRQTFGKGSVQVLYDIVEPGTRKESALKLTIAQYLTPGDQSIQEIGVTPDIELVPALVTKERVDLFSPPRLVREADLDKHFANGFNPQPETKKVVEADEKPVESMRYLVEVKKKEAEAAADDDEPVIDEPDEDALHKDWQVKFARELVASAPKTDRKSMLEAAREFLAGRHASEQRRIEEAIGALGVDWTRSEAKPEGEVSAKVKVTTTPARARPGEPFTVTVAVKNDGKAPLEQLRAYTRCEAEKTAYRRSCDRFDRREFLFGRIAPGETKSWTTEVKLPHYVSASRELLSLRFEEAHGNAPANQEVVVESIDLPRPAFAFTFQVIDEDGLAQPGESVDVRVDVKNVGDGASTKATYVSLRNQGNDKIFMKKGRVAIGEIQPGEVKSGVLTLEVKEGFDAAKGVPLKLEIGDRDLWEFTTGGITLPSLAQPPAVEKKARPQAVNLQKDQQILAAPVASAPVVAEAPKGKPVSAVAKVGEYLKVTWGEDRFGFVPASSSTGVASAKAGAPTAQVHHRPPVIHLDEIVTSQAPVVVDADRFRLTGKASAPDGLWDVRVFVDNEKVFFRSAASADNPEQRAGELTFSTEFPLKPGNNLVLVVAREDADFASQRTLVIHRRPPAVAAREEPEGKKGTRSPQ